jgi:hypothetical protein
MVILGMKRLSGTSSEWSKRNLVVCPMLTAFYSWVAVSSWHCISQVSANIFFSGCSPGEGMLYKTVLIN